MEKTKILVIGVVALLGIYLYIKFQRLIVFSFLLFLVIIYLSTPNESSFLIELLSILKKFINYIVIF